MKPKFMSVIFCAVIVCITTSFLIAPKKDKHPLTTTANVSIANWAGVTISGLKAVPSAGGTTLNFTGGPSLYTITTSSTATYFLMVHVTGHFATIHDDNYDPDYMAYPSSTGTNWYLIYDAPQQLNIDHKVEICSDANTPCW